MGFINQGTWWWTYGIKKGPGDQGPEATIGGGNFFSFSFDSNFIYPGKVVGLRQFTNSFPAIGVVIINGYKIDQGKSLKLTFRFLVYQELNIYTNCKLIL